VVPGRSTSLAQGNGGPSPTTSASAARAKRSKKLIAPAEKAGVYLNLENIFANGFLFSPREMVQFVDSSERSVRVHSIPATSCSINSPSTGFRSWASGSRTSTSRNQQAGRAKFTWRHPHVARRHTNWPAVMAALDLIDYRGYLTFEYFHPFEHWPESLVGRPVGARPDARPASAKRLKAARAATNASLWNPRAARSTRARHSSARWAAWHRLQRTAGL